MDDDFSSSATPARGSSKRAREETDPVGADARSTVVAQMSAIEDEGEIYYQAGTVCLDMVKKVFKDLRGFLTDFHFVFLPSREIRIQNCDETTRDMVTCSLTQFEYFQCADPGRTFRFSVSAKVLEPIIASLPLSSILSFYLSETCVDASGVVEKLCLRTVCMETYKTIDHEVFTLQDATVGGSAPPDTSVISGLDRYACEVRWCLREFFQALKNLGNSKDTPAVTISAMDSGMCEFTTDTPAARSKIRLTPSDRHFVFARLPSAGRVSNSFHLQSLLNFLKCRDLCGDVQLYLDSERPLVMKFDVAHFGVIHICMPIYRAGDE